MKLVHNDPSLTTINSFINNNNINSKSRSRVPHSKAEIVSSRSESESVSVSQSAGHQSVLPYARHSPAPSEFRIATRATRAPCSAARV